jgi:trigger factor
MADTENKTDEAVKNETPANETPRFESEAKTTGPCKVEVTIRVPLETITKEFDDRYKELIRTVAFPGFRLGHAPRRLVEKRLGDDIRAEVKEHLVTESFKDAIERHSIDPLREPEVDLASVELTDGMPMQYSAVFIVRPVVEVKDYSALSVKAARPEVSESQVEAVLAGMQRRHAVLAVRAGEKVAERDVAILDVLATVGDEKIVERENVAYEHPDQFVAGLHLPSARAPTIGSPSPRSSRRAGPTKPTRGRRWSSPSRSVR